MRAASGRPEAAGSWKGIVIIRPKGGGNQEKEKEPGAVWEAFSACSSCRISRPTMVRLANTCFFRVGKTFYLDGRWRLLGVTKVVRSRGAACERPRNDEFGHNGVECNITAFAAAPRRGVREVPRILKRPPPRRQCVRRYSRRAGGGSLGGGGRKTNAAPQRAPKPLPVCGAGRS